MLRSYAKTIAAVVAKLVGYCPLAGYYRLPGAMLACLSTEGSVRFQKDTVVSPN